MIYFFFSQLTASTPRLTSNNNNLYSYIIEDLRQTVRDAENQLNTKDNILQDTQEHLTQIEVKLYEVESERNYLGREIEAVKNRLSKFMVNSFPCCILN